MPTYQYACTSEACGLQFERVQSFTDDAISDCPDCSGRVRKVYGSVGVVFKGSGFYRTDSRSDKSTSTSGSSSSSDSSTGGSAGGTSGSSTGSSGGGEKSAAKPSTPPKSDTKAAAPAAS